MHGPAARAASDIYSFGVVLFEVFTGSLPFSAARGPDNPALAPRRASELMEKHLHDPPPRPTQVARDLPEGLEPIILRCLDKSPERRYPNMNGLLRDLAKLQERDPKPEYSPRRHRDHGERRKKLDGID